jgi:Holliday junction resolvase RusA-like endonuclease
MVASQPTIVLTLPVPPSANRLWRHYSRRRKPTLSPEYKAWLIEASWLAKMQLIGAPEIKGKFRPHIQYPENNRRDEDNWVKPLLDLCQRVGAVRNDKGSRGLMMEPVKRADCLVALYDLGGEPYPTPVKRPLRGPPKRPSASRAMKWAEIQSKLRPR